MIFKIVTAVAVLGLFVSCSKAPNPQVGVPTAPRAEESPSEYSVVGDWGQPVHGLRCRLAVGKPTIKPSERLTFRLELQNVAKEPVNILLEARGWFGSVAIDSANKMGWVPPAGKFRNAYRTLKPGEIISTSDFAAIHQVPISDGKHVFAGYYANDIELSDKHFEGWTGTAVKLWATHGVFSSPVEVVIKDDKE